MKRVLHYSLAILVGVAIGEACWALGIHVYLTVPLQTGAMLYTLSLEGVLGE